MARQDLSKLLGSSLDTAAATATPAGPEAGNGPTPAAPDQPSASSSDQGKDAATSAEATTRGREAGGAEGTAPRRPRRPSEPKGTPRREPSGTVRGPRYLELDRKELRIRGDQADELSALTRQLNRARAGAGERITDNTLIRVAIDVLLREKKSLAGVTETDLLNSVLRD